MSLFISLRRDANQCCQQTVVFVLPVVFVFPIWQFLYPVTWWTVIHVQWHLSWETTATRAHLLWRTAYPGRRSTFQCSRTYHQNDLSWKTIFMEDETVFQARLYCIYFVQTSSTSALPTYSYWASRSMRPDPPQSRRWPWQQILSVAIGSCAVCLSLPAPQ